MKKYYWSESLTDYKSSNNPNNDQLIEFSRINIFIGKNNSGKSRFLRSLCKNTKYYHELSPIEITWIQSEFQKVLNEHGRLTQKDLGNTNGFKRFDSTPLKIELNEIFEKIYPAKSFHEKLLHFADKTLELKDFYHKDQVFLNIASKLKINVIEWKKQSQFDKKLYIPVLRGLRPLNDKSTSTHQYEKRTKTDYFDDKDFINVDSIITGESFYKDLREALLGRPEQRLFIVDYQKLLSQYFFDGDEITLIPKHDHDVINIKVGSDEQHRVYELGDGLQQVLILTYNAFLNKDQRCAFFIEEPELHMHAGMLRQLMTLLLNETEHTYFLTSHSNHLIDMIDESNEVIVQKLQKKKDEHNKNYFQIDRCDRDRDLLAQLGVRPSSVYLANCTIWLEGITDRLYLTKYLQKYLDELKSLQDLKYEIYRRFMPNFHYAFVEYQGGNLVHWNFDRNEVNNSLDDQGLNARQVCANMLLIADGDISTKSDRVEHLANQMGADFHLIPFKEIENTLPHNIIIATAKSRFSRMQTDTKTGTTIEKLDNLLPDHFFKHTGLGKILDKAICSSPKQLVFAKTIKAGTIRDKLEFCREAIGHMETQDWALTQSARELCEKVFQHVDSNNQN